MNAIQRTIGKRKSCLERVSLKPRAPSEASIQWIADMAKHSCFRAPKGIFRYRSHEEANRDWKKWELDSIRAAKNGDVHATRNLG